MDYNLYFVWFLFYYFKTLVQRKSDKVEADLLDALDKHNINGPNKHPKVWNPLLDIHEYKKVQNKISSLLQLFSIVFYFSDQWQTKIIKNKRKKVKIPA